MRVVLRDYVQDIPPGEEKPRLLARNVLVKLRVEVEVRAHPDLAVADVEFVAVGHQLECDGAFRFRL